MSLADVLTMIDPEPARQDTRYMVDLCVRAFQVVNHWTIGVVRGKHEAWMEVPSELKLAYDKCKRSAGDSRSYRALVIELTKSIENRRTSVGKTLRIEELKVTDLQDHGPAVVEFVRAMHLAFPTKTVLDSEMKY